MVRLDLSYFYRLAVTFEAARHVTSTETYGSVWGPLYQVEQTVEGVCSDPLVGPAFRRAHGAGLDLVRALRELRQRPWTEQYGPYEKARIDNLIERFTTIFQSDLAVADAYYVVQKRGLDTYSLVSSGEVLFPEALVAKVPEAIADLREAGKCIAFELCTAAGFHMMRAVESVLRRYWEVQTGNHPKPRQRNIGTYLRGLRAMECGDEKVLSALQQLKDLHRNVLTHTEEFIGIDKAVSLLGMSRSVVDAMLDSIPETINSAPPAEINEFPPLNDPAEDSYEEID